MFLAGQTTYEPADDAREITPRALRLSLDLALAVVGGAVFCGWLALVGLHVGDDYRVTHTQGVWIAVTESASAGALYPPIFDGEHYAGTRYMPLPIVLNALAAGVVGDPLVGGKLLAALLMAVLLVLIMAILRGLSCSWPLAMALAATVVATETGLQAGSTIGGDLLAVVLQAGAVAAALRDRGRATPIAGALAGLALVSKLTGVWAFLAITTWLLLQKQWRRAGTFAAVSVATAAGVFGIVHLLTGGRLSEHLLAFSVAGVHGAGSLLRGPNQILYNLIGHASAAVVLFPLAVLGTLLARSWRQLSMIHLALGYSLLLLLVVYADVGTGFNQLLDLVVLVALAVGSLAGRAANSDARAGPVVVLAVVVAVIWAAGLDLVRTVGFDVRRSVGSRIAGTTTPRIANTVAALVQPGEEVLAEDPSIYVALGRRPLIMDPFMVMKLERTDPRRVDPLISWITNRRFDLVVLVVPLEDRNLDFWWNDFHFGPRVAEALRTSYGADRRVGRVFVYRPLP